MAATTGEFFSLKICVQPSGRQVRDEQLKQEYRTRISAYMARVERGDPHLDSGFDLLCPKAMVINSRAKGAKLDHQVVCVVKNEKNQSQPFYLYPRSSISGTPLRMSNSVGIIDAGYRGNIIAKVDNIDTPPDTTTDHEIERVTDHEIERFDRLFQVCSRTLAPFSMVELVDSVDETERGAGGFGSTGGTSGAASSGAGASAGGAAAAAASTASTTASTTTHEVSYFS